MRTIAALTTLALVIGVGVADEVLKSGPQVGQTVPGPFHPLNVTGAYAGEKHCLYCELGPAPVAMIFAREVSPSLTTLIKKIDAETAKNSKTAMGSFVVFLSNEEKLPAQLKDLAGKEKIKTTVLSIDNPAGPGPYKIAKDADVTVVLYNEHTVMANHTFRKGQLSDKAVNQIVADVSKILPRK
jgi:hypothetical protein